MKNIFIIALVTLLAAVSCTKDWEDMNVSPNSPDDVPMTNLLANSIVYTGDQFFDDWQGMNNFLSYSGHITKIAYIDEARYSYRPNVVNDVFRDYYRVQLDLSKMITKAQEAGKPYTEAAALTFSVFLWQMAVDQWGDIPYTQALQAESEEENLTPAYDKASDIYADLFVKLEKANTLFNEPVNEANPDLIGDGDFIYGSDQVKWQKFCNSLRLRMAMRTQNQAEFTKVTGSSTAPVFESIDDEAKLKWQGTAPYKEPWAENHEGRDDHGMAKTFIDMLLSLSDPRLPVYALPNETDGEYVGAPEGANNGDFQVNDISRIGPMYRDDVAGYSYFLRYAEVEFLLAEGALLGWGGDAQTYYETGVAAVFEETGMSDSLASYMAKPEVVWGDESVYTNQEKIWLQKWIALFKQGQELWAENRRTDFPVMEMSVGSVYPGHNRQPFRYPYPDNEFNLNGSNIAGPASVVDDHFWGEQLFWDKRTGVH